jgi:hypothetical protein
LSIPHGAPIGGGLQKGFLAHVRSYYVDSKGKKRDIDVSDLLKDTELVSIFIGSLLGDAHLHKPGNLIKYCQSLKHYDYLIYLWEKFYSRGLCGEPKIKHYYDKRTNKTYGSCVFYTSILSAFKVFDEMFYTNKLVYGKLQGVMPHGRA